MARGKQEWKSLHAHCGRRSGGHGQGLQTSYILPSRVWSSSSVFVKDRRGMRKSSTFLTTCTGTQTHAHSSLSPKGSTPRWTTPHSRTNNHSPAPPQPSLLPPSSISTQEQWVLPHPHSHTPASRQEELGRRKGRERVAVRVEGQPRGEGEN